MLAYVQWSNSRQFCNIKFFVFLYCDELKIQFTVGGVFFVLGFKQQET